MNTPRLPKNDVVILKQIISDYPKLSDRFSVKEYGELTDIIKEKINKGITHRSLCYYVGLVRKELRDSEKKTLKNGEGPDEFNENTLYRLEVKAGENSKKHLLYNAFQQWKNKHAKRKFDNEILDLEIDDDEILELINKV
jgi:hypothetical protein